MNTVTFIAQSLAQVHIRLIATCEGLTQEKVLWRPSQNANNIGFILWHLARGEDERINELNGSKTTLWESEGWYKKFGQPITSPDPGDRMGFHALAIPDMGTLIGYLNASHAQTDRYVAQLDESDLDTIPDPATPDITVASRLRHTVTHRNNHHGQIDFLRGLQDESWDLPKGTGMVLL